LIGKTLNGEVRPMRHFVLPLVLLLVFNGVAAARAEEPLQAAKVKGVVQKRGISEKSKVKVRLRSKAEVKGYISKIEDASFDVTDKVSGQVTTISYANVERVQGSGLTTAAKIGIIVGVGVVTIVVVFAAELKAHGY